MNLPFEYEQSHPGRVRRHRLQPPQISTSARVVILPVPLDRTTSYVPGTRTGPHEILGRLVAHGAAGTRRRETDVHGIGICTLPEMELPFAVDGRGDGGDSAGGVRARQPRQVSGRARRRAFDHGAGRRGRGRASTQDCRCCRSTRTRTCAIRSWARRTTTRARCAGRSNTRTCTQVGIRSLSTEEAAARPVAADDDLLRLQHAAGRAAGSIASSTRSATTCTSRSTVDGFDPAIMPAVGHAGAGRAELVRGADAARAASSSGGSVVGCDIVELSPDARQRRAELSVREAALQDPVVSVRTGGQDA